MCEIMISCLFKLHNFPEWDAGLIRVCLLLCLQAQCQEVRKRKELELQILMESIRGWEGEGIKTLGSVLYMSQVLIQNHGAEVNVIK